MLRTARRRLRHHPEAGLTLMEAVVAALLVGVLSAVVLGIIIQTQGSQMGNRSRVAAANLAAREIDLVRQEFMSGNAGPDAVADAGVVVNAHPLAGGTVGDPLEVDGTPYTVTRSTAWNITGAGVSACDGGALVDYPTLTVTVAVTWPNMGSIRPVVSHTALAPDKGIGVQSSSSFVAVKVVDSDGRANPGRSVTVTGPGFSSTGLTDALGCAVVEVTPSASGTAYEATMTDSGHVDIANNANPSKSVGTMTPGTLNNSVTFAYDRAASLTLRVQDPTGAGISDASVAGGQATVVASEFSGSGGETIHALAGLTTTVTNLWPTTYSAYFGTVSPGALPSVDLAPGGTGTLDIDYVPAQVTFTGLPAGTTGIVAVPTGSGLVCGSPGARTFSAAAPDATVAVLPGDWEFFATGSYFHCSPGFPGGLPLGAGDNGTQAWVAPSAITYSGAVPGGNLWAVDAALVGALGSCPGPAAVPIAQDVTAARGGLASLVAGDWYVYATDGAPDGACQGVAPGPFTLAPSQTLPLTWPAHTTTVSVTQVERYTGATSSGARPSVVISSSATLSCTRTSTTPAIGPTTFNLGAPGGQTTVLTASGVGVGTWYVYGWDTQSSASWNPRCRPAGTVVVGPTSGPLTLDFNVATPGTVGP